MFSLDREYKVDFRMHIDDVVIRPTELPDAVVAGLRRLMMRLELTYGAIDMRLTPEGDYVFLEINPTGQWLFVEHATGQPIAATLARAMARADAPAARARGSGARHEGAGGGSSSPGDLTPGGR
jgi:hypothetical protein